jgi:hypothetical protein
LVVVVVGGAEASDVDVADDEGDGLAPSDPDEQAARTTENTAVAAVAARIG